MEWRDCRVVKVFSKVQKEKENEGGETETKMDNYKTESNMRCPAQNLFSSCESYITLGCQVLALICLNKTSQYKCGRLTQIISCKVYVLRHCGFSLIVLTLKCKRLQEQIKNLHNGYSKALYWTKIRVCLFYLPSLKASLRYCLFLLLH